MDSHGQTANYTDVIQKLATEIDGLGIQIVDISENVSEVSGKVTAQAEMLDQFNAKMGELSGSNKKIKQVVQLTMEAMDRAVEETVASQQSVARSVVNIQGLVNHVSASRTLLDELQQALEGVAKSVRTIDNIAKQTNVLSLNATIGASKAGEAGKGFAVVAAEVKSLARQTSESTAMIEQSLAELLAQAERLRAQGETSAECAQSVGRDAEAIGGIIENIGQMIRGVGAETSRITLEADEINGHCTQLGSVIRTASDGVHVSSRCLEEASTNLRQLLGAGERLIALAVNSDVETSSTPFVKHCLMRAEQINRLFDEGAAQGAFQVDDFFQTVYVPMVGSEPPQFSTPYLAFTDRAIQPLLDEALMFSAQVVFCCILDLKGYLPTHNSKYSHPQGEDPVWNNAHCRNRRFFTDRVGMAAANNTERFLVQTYRRDMGGGEKALMMDVSAPIHIRGRHWGAVRLAFKPA